MLTAKGLRQVIGYGAREAQIELGIRANRCFTAPQLVSISVNARCDARCTTCDIWKQRPDEPGPTASDWKRVIARLRGWASPLSITFTGGEPFILDGFLDLLAYANDAGCYTNVSTNGLTFEPANIERILATGIDFAMFSLNSIEPEVHDRLKGIEGAHRTVVSAIERIAASGGHTRAGVMAVVTAANYRRLAEFALWAWGIGADSIDFQPLRENFQTARQVRPTRRAVEDNPLWQLDDLAVFERQLQLLAAARQSGCPIVSPPRDLEMLRTYFRDPDELRFDKRCTIGYRKLFVTRRGEIKLCTMYPSLGRATDVDLETAWYSDEAQRQRVAMLCCRQPCATACTREYSVSDARRIYRMRFGARRGAHRALG